MKHSDPNCAPSPVVHGGEDVNTETEALSRDEWSRRYAARIAAVAGWDQASADAAAEAVPDEYMGDYASPEEAADDEMSNWEDDGDE